MPNSHGIRMHCAYSPLNFAVPERSSFEGRGAYAILAT